MFYLQDIFNVQLNQNLQYAEATFAGCSIDSICKSRLCILCIIIYQIFQHIKHYCSRIDNYVEIFSSQRIFSTQVFFFWQQHFIISQMDRKFQSRCEWPITGEEIIVFQLKAFKEESRKCGSQAPSTNHLLSRNDATTFSLPHALILNDRGNLQIRNKLGH